MSSDRRKFLEQIGLIGTGAISLPLFTGFTESQLSNNLKKYKDPDPDVIAGDEDFWFHIQQAYVSNPNLVNLNNGGVSPQPKSVQRAFEHYNRLANDVPAYYLFREFEKRRKMVRNKLAAFAGVSPDEIALCRNTTEALETILFGLPLKKGDRILTTNQDYPNMLKALDQRRRRDGIEVDKISIPVPAEDINEVVELFKNAIKPNTRIILVCHMINLTGQIMPVKEICQMARKKGVEVVVDGAHSFGHLDFKISDLDCDYFGTSLHKWLCAPFGTGLMYIKKDKIEGIWPLLGGDEKQNKMIKKFDHLGTRSYPAELAISESLDFHLGIGSARKEARLRFLKNYWIERVIDHKGIKINSSLKDDFSGAIGNFSIEGINAREAHNKLHKDFNLYTTTSDHDDVKGVRVSPHVYTRTEDLDMLVKAIKVIAS